jgi:hypothetical protein
LSSIAVEVRICGRDQGRLFERSGLEQSGLGRQNPTAAYHYAAAVSGVQTIGKACALWAIRYTRGMVLLWHRVTGGLQHCANFRAR